MHLTQTFKCIWNLRLKQQQKQRKKRTEDSNKDRGERRKEKSVFSHTLTHLSVVYRHLPQIPSYIYRHLPPVPRNRRFRKERDSTRSVVKGLREREIVTLRSTRSVVKEEIRARTFWEREKLLRCQRGQLWEVKEDNFKRPISIFKTDKIYKRQ
jgi:hypothetical protein